MELAAQGGQQRLVGVLVGREVVVDRRRSGGRRGREHAPEWRLDGVPVVRRREGGVGAGDAGGAAPAPRLKVGAEGGADARVAVGHDGEGSQEGRGSEPSHPEFGRPAC